MQNEQTMVVALARDALQQIAPDELPLLEDTAKAYFGRSRRGREAQESDEVLGFGVGAVAMILTPVVLRLAKEALRFAAEQAAKAAMDEAGGILRRLLRRLAARLRRSGKDRSLVLDPLTTHQLGLVRDLVFRRGQELGLPEDKAGLMADTIVGGLALQATAT